MSNTHSSEGEKIHTRTHTQYIYPELYNYIKHHMTKCFSIASTALENIPASFLATSTVQSYALSRSPEAVLCLNTWWHHIYVLSTYWTAGRRRHQDATNLPRVCPSTGFLPQFYSLCCYLEARVHRPVREALGVPQDRTCRPQSKLELWASLPILLVLYTYSRGEKNHMTFTFFPGKRKKKRYVLVLIFPPEIHSNWQWIYFLRTSVSQSQQRVHNRWSILCL